MRKVIVFEWMSLDGVVQALAQPLNTLPKYVASRTLRDPLAWRNSKLLEGDLAESVDTLKREAGNDLLVIGSTEIATALLEHDLVDELRLMIDPVMLGGGKRFFRDDGVCRRLALVTSETTPAGAILPTYARSGTESAERPQRLPRPPART